MWLMTTSLVCCSLINCWTIFEAILSTRMRLSNNSGLTFWPLNPHRGASERDMNGRTHTQPVGFVLQNGGVGQLLDHVRAGNDTGL